MKKTLKVGYLGEDNMKLMRCLLVMGFILIVSVACSYAGLDDKSDKLSNDQSNVFSPGYINATMQKTQAIIKQAEYGKSSMGNNIENADEVTENKLSSQVNENAADKPAFKLQKKTSDMGQSSSKQVSSVKSVLAPEGSVTMSTNSSINIGTGTLQHYENGRLISEYINGVKYIYAGFDKVGFAANGTVDPIKNAINESQAGDIILVKAGVYTGDLALSGGTRVYGGFDDTGNRNIDGNQTTIVGNISSGGSSVLSELNGFYGSGGTITVSNGGNFQLAYVNYGGNVNSLDGTCITFYNTSAGNVYANGNVMQAGNDYFGNYSGSLYIGDASPDFTVSNVGLNRTESVTTTTNVSQSNQFNLNDITKNRTDSQYSDSAGLYSTTGNSGYSGSDGLVSQMKTFFKENNGGLAPDGSNTLAVRQAKDSATESALAVPVKAPADISDGTNGITMAAMLANILKNPTGDQRLILDTMMSLLNDVDKNPDEKSRSPEVKKAQDDLIQAVANILIAQAIPDLLKEGDMSNIKGIFQDMDTQKNRIITEYNLAVEPYYREVKKLLAKNLSILQLNNIVSKTMIKEELSKTEPNEVDRIINKIKKMQNVSFEAAYILQEESKLHSNYIDPNKKILDNKMKAMLEGFTARLSKILEATKK